MARITNRAKAKGSAGRISWILAVAIVLVIAAGASAEEAERPSVGVDVAVNSKYVWRGLILTDDPVLQPSLTVGYKGLGLNVWANTDLTDINGTPGEVNELDYTLDYSFSVSKVNLDVGVIQYTFPHTGFEPTTELFGTAAVDVLLSPTVKIYWDVDEVGGLYGTVGIGHSFSLMEVKGISSSLDLSGSIGYATSSWNEGYYGVKSSGLVDLLLTAGLSIPIDAHLSVTPYVSYSKVIDGDLKDAVADDSATFFGATLSVAF